MDNKFYWFVKDEDDKFFYKLDTYENIDNDYLIGDEAVVVHPENEIFDDEYRDYNKPFIKYFEEIQEKRVKKLIDVQAPDIVIEHEKEAGPFTKNANLIKKTV